jgi:hypothetical protein
MPPDPYDRSSHYLLRRNARALLAWLLKLRETQLEFVQWLDTRRLPWPGQPDRSCDTVAWLRDMDRHGLPWAVVVEFQFAPDPEMFGRLLVYLGQVWLELRPSDLPGDRFCVTAVVVNLTGRGNSGRQLVWPEADVETKLKPAELNLAGLRAAEVLDGVEAGSIPPVVLAWLPVMQNGAEDGIIQRWLMLAGEEADAGRRADLGLALVFAEAAGCRALWTKALEGWNVVESQVVKQWQDEAERKAKAATLIRLLQVRYGELPAEITEQVRQAQQAEELDRWLVVFATATSLEQFRRDTGL